MPNKDHVEMIGRGFKIWNQWRKGNPDIVPNLSDFDFIKKDLEEYNFSNANLNYSSFIGSNLKGAGFQFASLNHTDLSFTNLENAFLSNTNLNRAKLNRANLRNANISYSYLVRTEISEADLSHAILLKSTLNNVETRGTAFSQTLFNGTSINDCDLSDAHFLSDCLHDGPSSIDHRTLIKSRNIPLGFLRGLGLPEEIVNYYFQPINYYSCFISYSSQDREIALKLYSDLQDNSIRCWYAPEDLRIGDKIIDSLDVAVETQDKLLIIISEASVHSNWVEKEVNKALEEERLRNKLIIVPIRIDDSIFNTEISWVSHLKNTRNIGDFLDWENGDVYDRVLKHLLQALKNN